jgi:hypothetical protein
MRTRKTALQTAHPTPQKRKKAAKFYSISRQSSEEHIPYHFGLASARNFRYNAHSLLPRAMVFNKILTEL